MIRWRDAELVQEAQRAHLEHLKDHGMKRLILLFALGACGHHGSTSAADGGTKNDSGLTGLDGGSSDLATLPGVDGGAPSAICTAPGTPPDTSSPRVTLTSCTQQELQAAISGGGVIAFACGDATIAITSTLVVPADLDTTIDGGGHITLDGGGTTRILSMTGADYRKNDHRLALVGLTLKNGKSAGTKPYASAPSPCSQGFYDGYGGALSVSDATLWVQACTFDHNVAESIGPDVAGGAISLAGSKQAIIIGSTFTGNSASNGGAIGSLNSQLDVYDSVFGNNRATGHDANGDDQSKCSVKATNGQYQTGSGGNGGAISIDGGSDTAHTFCGTRFVSNQSGQGALGGALFRTPDGAKQTTTIDRCLFDGNQAPTSAGAAYFHNSTLIVTASTFKANSSASFGAIQADGTTFDFSNDTFSGNEGTSIAGTLALFGGDGKIRYSTFAGNKTGSFAADIFGNPTLTIEGCLFQGAVGTSGPLQCQVTGTGSSNLQFPADNACTPDTMFSDAQLGAIGDHGGPTPTVLPAAGSPAIGAGHDCPATDQRGVTRPSDPCTIGAVEGSQ
ncbi:MAG: choice-of-anchor Q domain-containing protein [Polyangia bacterium]